MEPNMFSLLGFVFATQLQGAGLHIILIWYPANFSKFFPTDSRMFEGFSALILLKFI